MGILYTLAVLSVGLFVCPLLFFIARSLSSAIGFLRSLFSFQFLLIRKWQDTSSSHSVCTFSYSFLMHSSGHCGVIVCRFFCVCMRVFEWANSEQLRIHTHVVRFVKCVFAVKMFCARSRACTQTQLFWSTELTLRPLVFSLHSCHFYWLERRVLAGKVRERKALV